MNTPKLNAIDIMALEQARKRQDTIALMTGQIQHLRSENARLREALRNMLTCMDASDGDSLANVANEARALLAKLEE